MLTMDILTLMYTFLLHCHCKTMQTTKHHNKVTLKFELNSLQRWTVYLYASTASYLMSLQQLQMHLSLFC